MDCFWPCRRIWRYWHGANAEAPPVPREEAAPSVPRKEAGPPRLPTQNRIQNATKTTFSRGTKRKRRDDPVEEFVALLAEAMDRCKARRTSKYNA